jgi:hypothetical protein
MDSGSDSCGFWVEWGLSIRSRKEVRCIDIYVEIQVQGSMDKLWSLTQTPDLHARWDLRFSDITYLPRHDENEPQRFLYTTRIGFGLAIQGRGETVGQRHDLSGNLTSALKFWSEDPKSLIREGAGYWRYIQTPDGVRFFTGYDYRVRFGALGRVFDTLLFRPLIGWATAWSFDRLRLWIEKGIDPAISLQRSLIHATARCALAFVWLYQGAIPKLLYAHADEVLLAQETGLSVESALLFVQMAGWSELLFGLAMLLWFRQRWHFLLTMALMIAAAGFVAVNSPRFLAAAFNPVTLNVLMIALALIGLLVSHDLPTAKRCLRRPKEAGK